MAVIFWLSPADSQMNRQNPSQNKIRSNPEIYYPGDDISDTTAIIAKTYQRKLI